MNKFLRNFFLFLSIIVSFGFFVNTTFAAITTADDEAGTTMDKTPIAYTLMETSVSPGEVDPENAEICSYLAGVLVLLIGISGVLSVLILFVGGLEYLVSGANSSILDDAKQRMWGAIVGLIIAIGAWLILNSINPIMLNGCFVTQKITVQGEPYVEPADQSSPSITVNPTLVCLAPNAVYDKMDGVTATDPEDGNITSDIKVLGDEFTTDLPDGILRKGPFYITYFVEDEDGNVAQAYRTVHVRTDCEEFLNSIEAIAPEYVPVPFAGNCNVPMLRPEEFSEEEQRIRDLLGPPAAFNKGACPDLSCSYKVVTGGCSSFEGLHPLAIAGYRTLTNIANCGILKLTGGTEAGHASHGPGKPVIDITGGNGCLNTYVKTHWTSKGVTSRGFRYYIVPIGSGSAMFLDELISGNHWHIKFIN